MTGREKIRAEMINRGCSKGLADSKSVDIALDIISESDEGVYVNIREAEETLKRLRREIKNLEADKERLVKNYLEHKEVLTNRLEKLKAKRLEDEAYLKEFSEKLLTCETAEARDTLRMLQTFRNSIEIKSMLDNTAYIIGMAAIITGKKFDPVKEFRKIKLEADMEVHRRI